MPLRSSIEFASALQYAVRSSTDEGRKKSFGLRDAIKKGSDTHLELLAELIANDAQFRVIHDLLGATTILVPTPGSAVHRAGSLWVPLKICEALRARGLAASVEILLQRTVAVPKSAFAGRGARPNAQRHYDTIAATPAAAATDRIVLVDDVVTSGATLLGAASKLVDLYPEIPIVAFAAVRAVSGGDVANLRDPVRGAITMNDYNDLTTRRP